MKYRLLSTLQTAVLLALFVIGATLVYALNTAPSSTGTAPAAAPRATTEAPGDPIVAKGKIVWRANACGTCHAKDMRTDATVPALTGVTNRWAAEPREHLYA